MEKEKKNMNFKSQYDIETHNFKKLLEEKHQLLQRMKYDKQMLLEITK
jgi:hypothetical protein